MRTSFEISDALLSQVRRLARERGTSMRALVEEGLRRVITDAATPGYTMRDARFTGQAGFAPGVSEGDLAESIRAFNEGRELP